MSADIVSVTLNVASAGVTRQGFGIPLVLGCSMTGWSERVRFYTGTAGVLEDFAITDPEYLAAAALFSQTFQPERIAIGRRAILPTQRFDIAVATVRDNHEYTVRITHPDGTTEIASYTSDGTALNDEIAAGLVSAINGLTGTAFHDATAVGAGGSQTVQLVSTTAGEWLDVRVGSIADLNVEQDHADPGVATDLAAIAVEDSSWFALVNPWNSTAEGAAISTWAEANSKYFAAGTVHSEAATIASVSATDAPELAKDATLRFTQYVYSPHMGEFLEAARLGRFLPMAPGSVVWLNKPLAGCTAPVLTETHRTNLKAKNCDWLEVVGGVSIMRGNGKVASGAYIDDVTGLEWLQSEIKSDILDTQIGADKIPYTDAGIELLGGVVLGTLKRGVAAGVLAASPAPTVSVPKAANVSSGDRLARTLNNLTGSVLLAGAIQKTTIIVNVAQ